MTIYRLKFSPLSGTFASATEAILFALLNDLPTAWEAVSK